MTGRSHSDAGLPAWLQHVPPPSEEEFQAWDERQAARENALEAIAGGMLAGNPELAAVAFRSLGELPPVGLIGYGAGHNQQDDLLVAALNGRATTQDLVDGLGTDALQLTDDQESFVGADAIRLRVLVLSIQQDVSPQYLERHLFPDGQPRLTMAARSENNSSEKLANWLESHPELTGATPSVHWHG